MSIIQQLYYILNFDIIPKPTRTWEEEKRNKQLREKIAEHIVKIFDLEKGIHILNFNKIDADDHLQLQIMELMPLIEQCYDYDDFMSKPRPWLFILYHCKYSKYKMDIWRNGTCRLIHPSFILSTVQQPYRRELCLTSQVPL
jgi:hypothetical protein